MSSRRRDRLVGAAVALAAVAVVVLLALVGFAWWVSDPAPATGAAPENTDPGGSGLGAGSPDAPDELAVGETWLGDLVLDAGTVLTTDATLRDLAASGQDVRTGPAGTLAGRLEVQATVPFEVVAQELGPGTTVGAAEAGEASVTRDVEVAGRVVTVVATGTVGVERGLVVVVPRTVDIGGPTFLAAAVGAAARELVTIEQEVEGLPDGLVLREVEVRDDGFRVRLDGEDVRHGGG
ncbi:LmeA family phospholipid-binding protein [Jannaschia sp. R86511]|uniref:LmeA family phospholipid-binding protein n=1 Tax=Jannaschia sp. R86511 TaxID=3093853 RepID=UPI0036D22002